VLTALAIGYLAASALVTMGFAALLSRTRKQTKRDLRVVSEDLGETAPEGNGELPRAA